MSLARLRQPERAPSARVIGAASLAGHGLRFWKRGRDGSGKCTIVSGLDEVVHGVLVRLPPPEKRALDRSEGLGEHYHERELDVLVGAERRRAWTYVAAPDRIDEGLLPFDWYLGLLLEGAAGHALPAPYVRWLRDTPARPDPDAERTRRGRLGVPPERLP